MKIESLVTTVRDVLVGRTVFSEPYEKDGTTVITAARVSGGGGGGGGQDEKGEVGEGGGFGLQARPTGAFVIKEGQVAWRPAVDVNRLMLAVTAIAVTFFLTRARLGRAKLRAKKKTAKQRSE